MTSSSGTTGTDAIDARAVVPVLTDGVVSLRALRPDDEPAIVELCTDPEMIRWTTIPVPYGPLEARAFVAEADAAWRDDGPRAKRYWAIEVADPVTGLPRYAGTIDYRPTSDRTAEVGYALHPATRGSGLGAAALRLLVDHAFDVAGLTWLHWRAAVGNWGSRKTAWAVGFRVEGTVRGLLSARDEPALDGWIGSLHRDDPRRHPHPWYAAPRLERAGILLRPLHDADAAAWPESLDPANARFMAGITPTRSEFAHFCERERERMASGSGVGWTIAEAVGDAPLGFVHVINLDRALRAGTGEIGYALVEPARGRGVLGVALDLATTWALTPRDAGGLGLRRLGAVADVENSASRRRLAAAGYAEVGVAHDDRLERDGRLADTVLYERLHVGGFTG